MPIIPLSCPNCGAQLEANSDDSILTCMYCGGNFVMKDAIVHNYIQNTVNITAGTVNVVNQKDFMIEGGVLKKYQGEAVDVVIPNNVVVITEAFKDLRIKNVTIPDSVTEIGFRAFEGCASLTSVTIPDSVTTIGLHAFHGCASLSSVIIPDSVTTIGSCAFHGCASLSSVIIPDSVTTIGSCAFHGCTSLSSVIIPDSVTTIGSNPFSGCNSLTSITVPDSISQEKWYEIFEGTPPYYWRREGKCSHCGGSFNGLLTRKCAVCNLPKDY